MALSRRFKKIVITSVALVLTLSLSAVALLGWLRSNSGRRYVGEQLEAFVATEIVGRMRIREVVEISTSGIVLEGVGFFAPGGTKVIDAKRVELEVDWAALILEQRVVTERGRINGGTVTLTLLRGGDLALDRTFRAPNTTYDPSAGDDKPVDLQRLAFSDLTADARIDGVPSVRATGLHGILHIVVPRPGAKVRFAIGQLGGLMRVKAPIPFSLHMHHGRAHFDGALAQRVTVDTRGSMGGSPIRFRTIITVKRNQPKIAATLDVDGAEGWLRASPMITQATAARLASSAFDFSVNMSLTQ